MKVCTRCGIAKDTKRDFSPNQTRCKDCRNEMAREKTQRNTYISYSNGALITIIERARDLADKKLPEVEDTDPMKMALKLGYLLGAIDITVEELKARVERE